MSLFSKKFGPVVFKESNDVNEFIEKMQQILIEAPNNLKPEIEKQIKLANYGQIGEKQVMFELRNSGIDMYILHDLYLEAEGMSAQIDYLIITHKKFYIIECKNLVGDIKIDNKGNFVRSYEMFGKKIEEGIYSPITQNERHMEVIKKLCSWNNPVLRYFFEKHFEETYNGVVVLANPKTRLNDRYAKKEIKDKVIRADQLITYIKKHEATEKSMFRTEKEIQQFAESFLKASKPNKSDYSKKYEDMLKQIKEEASANDSYNVNQKDEELISALKKFRLEYSRAEGLKPYFVFTNEQMEALIESRPQTKEELLAISGFGKVKAERYGEYILELIRKH